MAAQSPITVYYWPMFGRAGSVIRMLEHGKHPYTVASSFDEISAVCSAFGCDANDVFAPPVVRDGDLLISQSTACCLHVGQKLNLCDGITSTAKAMQYMSDIVDLFELGLTAGLPGGKGAADVKAFLTGDRFPKVVANLQRGIKGPFFFGEEPTFVDFFLCNHMDWAEATLLNRLKESKGVDAFAPFEKLMGVVEGIRGLDSYKGYTGDLPVARDEYQVKDEFLDAF
jgi:hypothetical protein